jgi:glycosyltransferase involved in cell wall biosynthesis
MAVTSDIFTDMRVIKVASFLSKNNCQVQVVGRNTSDFELKVPFETKRFKMCFSRSFLFYLEYNLRFLFYALFRKADVIVSNDLDTLFACSLLSKIKRIPLMYDSHEYFTESVGLQGRNRIRAFWLWIERNCMPAVSKAYTVSQPIADAYKTKYNIDFKLVRNFSSVENLPSLELNTFFPRRKVILYQGVFNPNRGLEETIQAMQFLDDSYLFVLVGYGELEIRLKSLTNELNLNQQVYFTGKLPYEKMMQYTYQADLGIALEASVGKSFEYSLPNKVFDYIHASLPFISLGTPEVKKIIEQDEIGVIIPNNQPETIAREIEKLLNDTELYQRIQHNQQRVRQNYTWENEEKVLKKIYFG